MYTLNYTNQINTLQYIGAVYFLNLILSSLDSFMLKLNVTLYVVLQNMNMRKARRNKTNLFCFIYEVYFITFTSFQRLEALKLEKKDTTLFTNQSYQ